VVKPDGSLARDDEEGELMVAGPSVMLGYWGDGDRTSRAFADLTGIGGPDRAYRTGDLVLRDTRGLLHYHGRIDRMVKRRGFRIEPAEIEAALSAHPDVEECAVLALPGEETAYLKAFVLAMPGKEPQVLELKGFLSGRVPRYMIPDALELVQSLPRTSTGKIDRRRLGAT